ncbi:MAG: hypothetical protein ACW986_14330 [Promethearchaeota archaeon]|jgi:hypothetical protein
MTKGKLFSVTLFGIIILGMLSTSVMASLYQTTLTKGTEVFTVNQYNDSTWKTTVNASSNPSFWFEGDANVTGAKSKTTILGWNDNTWQTWDAFISLFMSEYFSFEDLIILLTIMNNIGYNETTINANYTGDYNLWYGVRAVWNFTEGSHLEQPSYSEGVLVFKDPLDFKAMLDDYNTLAAELNGNMFIQLSGLSFPNITADDFLWQLALNGLAVAKPQSGYLTELITELGCQNASSNGNTLIFNRFGETNYTVEISYGEKGTMSAFVVKDIGENIIFKIASTNEEWIFFLILTIIAACGAGLVVFIILSRRKPKK